MYLSELLKSVGKKYQKVHIKGICFDSRKAKKGDIFLQSKEREYLEQNLFKKQY